jgi:hypothetical protein
MTGKNHAVFMLVPVNVLLIPFYFIKEIFLFEIDVKPYSKKVE